MSFGYRYVLGVVDEFEAVSGGGDVDHAHEARGKLVVAGGNGAVGFQAAEHALDAIALLVKSPIMFDFHPAVWSARNDGLDIAARKVCTDGVSIVAFIRQERLWCPLRQRDKRTIDLAICRFANR